MAKQLLFFNGGPQHLKSKKQLNREAQQKSPKSSGSFSVSGVGAGAKASGTRTGKAPTGGSKSVKAAASSRMARDSRGQPAVLNKGYLPDSLFRMLRPVEDVYSNDWQSDYGKLGSGRSIPHQGVDFSKAEGTPIRAVTSGIVDQARWDGPYGNRAVIFHGEDDGKKLETMYAHLAKFTVKEGDKVAQGDVIGYVGSTGNSTGPHLHFETWENGNPVNPSKYLDGSVESKLRSKVLAGEPDIKKQGKLDEFMGFGLKASGSLSGKENKASKKATKVLPTKDKKLEAFISAIAEQESNASYDAVGVPVDGNRAYGKYQIMDFNITGRNTGWDYEALDRDISVDTFLEDPAIQEEIARYKLASYYKQFGAEGAAKAWYGGPGVANANSDSPQYGGPSINDYASEVLQKMRSRL